MTTPQGRLRNNESFCGMIENLGDAYEAAEECFGMVWWLARALAVRMPGPSDSPSRTEVQDLVREAQVNYKDGLRIGGVQRER